MWKLYSSQSSFSASSAGWSSSGSVRMLEDISSYKKVNSRSHGIQIQEVKILPRLSRSITSSLGRPDSHRSMSIVASQLRSLYVTKLMIDNTRTQRQGIRVLSMFRHTPRPLNPSSMGRTNSNMSRVRYEVGSIVPHNR